MPKKPKSNQKASKKDPCQTPGYALDPLLPYLPAFCSIWEPAAGEGNIVTILKRRGHYVIAGDVLLGHDYFSYEPAGYSVQVTNPPYSLKYKWIKRACELGSPFALLMPSDAIFAKQLQNLYRQYEIGMLIPPDRIDYKMPNLGWQGEAQFHSSWYTFGLGVPKGLNFVPMFKPKKAQILADPLRTYSPERIEMI